MKSISRKNSWNRWKNTYHRRSSLLPGYLNWLKFIGLEYLDLVRVGLDFQNIVETDKLNMFSIFSQLQASLYNFVIVERVLNFEHFFGLNILANNRQALCWKIVWLNWKCSKNVKNLIEEFSNLMCSRETFTTLYVLLSMVLSFWKWKFVLKSWIVHF